MEVYCVNCLAATEAYDSSMVLVEESPTYGDIYQCELCKFTVLVRNGCSLCTYILKNLGREDAKTGNRPGGGEDAASLYKTRLRHKG